MKLLVRPYLPPMADFARAVFSLVRDDFAPFGFELEFTAEPACDTYPYETEGELFEKHPGTIVVSEKRAKDALSMASTPGIGSSKQKAVLLTSLEGHFQPGDLRGVAWHEIGENIFQLHHHPPVPGDPCAMEEVVTKGEIARAIAGRALTAFNSNVLDRYKHLPPRFCQSCRIKIPPHNMSSR